MVNFGEEIHWKRVKRSNKLNLVFVGFKDMFIHFSYFY